MASEGDVALAREGFIKHRFANLDFLLSGRFHWMNKYLSGRETVIEIGAGAGFSEFYLSPKPILTDAVLLPWIDQKVEAFNMPFKDQSVDCIIASHTIHHFYSPMKFLLECSRVLKNNGVLVIQEINTSLLTRVFLRLMRHEGWSYDVDVFNPEAMANDPNDLWSANCAIPELLFSSHARFEEALPQFKIEKDELNECFVFPLSGGVIAKVRVPELNHFVLKIVGLVDRFLIALAPAVFAMGRSVVLKKSI